MMQMNRGEFKVTQYRKEVVPSAQKSEAEKMFKKQAYFDHIWTVFGGKFGPPKYGQTEIGPSKQHII